MSDNTGGGKSTLVQAPQKSSAPIRTSTVGGGFLRNQKSKKGMTAGDYQMPTPPKPSAGYSSSAPKNPYPQLTRNDKCLCLSGKKYKHCCLR